MTTTIGETQMKIMTFANMARAWHKPDWREVWRDHYNPSQLALAAGQNQPVNGLITP